VSTGFCTEAAATEPIAATAPAISGWVIIEAPGPWGKHPLLDGSLGPILGPALAARTADSNTRVLLARRPKRTSDPTLRRVWFAHVAPGGVRQRIADLPDLEVLLDIDLTGVGRCELPPLGKTDLTPHLFICQNGKRDACCTRLGRALITEVGALEPEHVWETTHLNGHRFAPTALLLPYGVMHGRLDAPSAQAVLTQARLGHTVVASTRGRTSLPQPLQAAELAVRGAYAVSELEALDGLRVDSSGRAVPWPTASKIVGEMWHTEVRHRDGRAWRVKVSAQNLDPRSESCGGQPVAGVTYIAAEPQPIAGW